MWILLFVIFVLIGGIVPPESHGAPAHKQCIKGTCRRQKQACVKAFRKRAKKTRAACKGGFIERRECIRVASSNGKLKRRACWRAFDVCKECCRSNEPIACSVQVCGDGQVVAGEECDDGNDIPGDGCSPVCSVAGPLAPRCGDGNVSEGEQCESNDDCPGRKICNDCNCGVCGNGTLDDGEECEDDLQCADGEGCVQCRCGPKVGIAELNFGESSWFEGSLLPNFALGEPRSTPFRLEAGPRRNVIGVNGVADVRALEPYFITIDVVPPVGDATTICIKVFSIEGQLFCDGGPSVDVEVTLDSLAEGSDDSCEGFEGNSEVPVTSGNEEVYRVGVNPDTTSPPGSMLLRSMQTTLTQGTNGQSLPLGTDCTTLEYPEPEESWTTTGTITGRVDNPCPAGKEPPSLSATGAPFDCDHWTEAERAGQSAFAIPSEEPSTILPIDATFAGVFGP